MTREHRPGATVPLRRKTYGFQALLSNSTGAANSAFGWGALASNTTGDSNTATGMQALLSNTIGTENTADGALALQNNTTGFNNTAIGVAALGFNTTGGGNLALGDVAGINVTTADNVICVGSNGANVSNSCFIGWIRGRTTAQTDAIPVLIDSVGQLGRQALCGDSKMRLNRWTAPAKLSLVSSP